MVEVVSLERQEEIVKELLAAQQEFEVVQVESRKEPPLPVSAVAEVSQELRYPAALQAEPEVLLELLELVEQLELVVPVVESVLEPVRQELILAGPALLAALVAQAQALPLVAWGLGLVRLLVLARPVLPAAPV